MTPLYVTSDWHIGAIRAGGTTPATAYQLRQDLLDHFGRVLDSINDGNLLLNGDMCDGPNIPMADLAQLFSLLSNWLERTKKKLYLPPGNHDLSKNSTTFSSFQFMARLLSDRYPEQAFYLEGGHDISDGCYVLSHVANQDLLDLELAKIPECNYCFVHTNYDNEFAVCSDHALNISKEWAQRLPVKHLVFAHEHIGRTELSGKVVIVGNASPSSVSDCLGNDTKYMIKITDAGIEHIETWHAESDFSTQDWRELTDTGRFIRITGEATAAEAAIVAQGISRFRQQAKALVITNAVKIEGTDDAEVLALSHEEVTAFNVEAALMELLTEEEGAKVQALLKPKKKEENAQAT